MVSEWKRLPDLFKMRKRLELKRLWDVTRSQRDQEIGIRATGRRGQAVDGILRIGLNNLATE